MKLSLIAALALVSVGCSAPSDISTSNEAGTTDTQRLMDFLDYPDTDATLLDVTVGLDSRAAKNIVAARSGADGLYPSSDDAPFTTVAQLDAVAYVGAATISKLQAYANAHPAPPSENVEGVTFSGWQSVAVVWGVNHATAADLDQFLDARAAKALAAAAPFASVAQMGPVAYVGSSALTALRAHAAAWWTASKAPSCVASFEAAVGPKLTNLLFMSESDRPLDVVAFPGAGNQAPTAASVLALVNAPAGSSASPRSVSDFYGDLEADDAAAAAVEAEFGTLEDVVYVAVINPNDPVLVDVYLVGRTSCGDLVGLHSVSVET